MKLKNLGQEIVVGGMLLGAALGVASCGGESPTSPEGQETPLGAKQLINLILGEGSSNFGVGKTPNSVSFDGIVGGPHTYMKTQIDTEGQGCYEYNIDTNKPSNSITIGTLSKPLHVWLIKENITGPKSGTINPDFPAANLEYMGSDCPGGGKLIISFGEVVVPGIRPVEQQTTTTRATTTTTTTTTLPACGPNTVAPGTCNKLGDGIGDLDGDGKDECYRNGTILEFCPAV